MKLSQMKNRVEEQKLVEFFDNQVSAFIAEIITAKAIVSANC